MLNLVGVELKLIVVVCLNLLVEVEIRWQTEFGRVWLKRYSGGHFWEGKFLYTYKDTVGVPPLAMVDDMLLISNCGLNSVLVNGFINSKTNFKKLQYGVDKCHKMHVGSDSHL